MPSLGALVLGGLRQESRPVSCPNEAQGLEQLLQTNRPSIEKYIRSRARTREDAEDLVQNVLLKAVRHVESFRGDCPFSQWLLRIAVNEVKNYYRRLSGERCECWEDSEEALSASLQHTGPVPCPDEEAQTKLMAERLIEAVQKVCNEEEQNVISMVYQGESFEEIASLLNTKSATVRSRFLRARTKLLGHLIAHDQALLGGTEAIQLAIERAKADDCGESLDDAEVSAIDSCDERSAAFRTGSVKIARFLQIAVILIGFLEAACTI